MLLETTFAKEARAVRDLPRKSPRLSVYGRALWGL